MKKYKKSLFTVRNRNKSIHPHIIVNASKTKFKAVSITHSEYNGRHKNIPPINNPNKLDKTKSYFQNRIIKGFKFNFLKAFKNYQLSNEDIESLIKFLKSKIQK